VHHESAVRRVRPESVPPDSSCAKGPPRQVLSSYSKGQNGGRPEPARKPTTGQKDRPRAQKRLRASNALRASSPSQRYRIMAAITAHTGDLTALDPLVGQVHKPRLLKIGIRGRGLSIGLRRHARKCVRASGEAGPRAPAAQPTAGRTGFG